MQKTRPAFPTSSYSSPGRSDERSRHHQGDVQHRQAFFDRVAADNTYAPGMVQRAREEVADDPSISILQDDAEHLKHLESRSFDAVICVAVLEHVPSKRAAAGVMNLLDRAGRRLGLTALRGGLWFRAETVR